jgi:hypothetical protein
MLVAQGSSLSKPMPFVVIAARQTLNKCLGALGRRVEARQVWIRKDNLDCRPQRFGDYVLDK